MGGAIQMNYIKVMIFFYALTTSYCAGAGEINDANNGFQFVEPMLQRKFESALREEGIVFQLRKDGMVIYSPDDDEKVSEIKREILRTSLSPSIRFENQDSKTEFIQKLIAKKIQFFIEIKRGQEWVAWSEKDDFEVKKIRDEVLENEIHNILKNRNQQKRNEMGTEPN